MAEYLLSTNELKQIDLVAHNQYAIILLSSASSLKLELDYLCLILSKRVLKLQHECSIDLHLQQTENADLIEDELQTELITKLCTHELLHWHSLLLASTVSAGTTLSASTITSAASTLASLPSVPAAGLSTLASSVQNDAGDLKSSP